MRPFPLLGGEAQPAASAAMDSGADFDLAGTAGFLVADARGRIVGRVEGPMYGASGATPDALSVRFSLLRWRRRLVPASAIAAIDDRTKVIGLGIDRDAIRAFLQPMPETAVTQLRVLIANERRDRLELLAQVVIGLGHDVIARGASGILCMHDP